MQIRIYFGTPAGGAPFSMPPGRCMLSWENYYLAVGPVKPIIQHFSAWMARRKMHRRRIWRRFRDGGLRAVQKIFKHLFQPLLAQPTHAWNENPKGALQELLQQAWRTNPEYRVVQESGPAHARAYTVDVLRDGAVIGTGAGASKRDAETAAARHALEHLRAAAPPGA